MSKITILVIFGVCVLLIAFYYENKDVADRNEIYCVMTNAWAESNGSFGWPPFNGKCE